MTIATIEKPYLGAIERRLIQIAAACDISLQNSQSLNDSIQHISDLPSGEYLIWLGITGRYPTREQSARFHSLVQVHGIHTAITQLVNEIKGDRVGLLLLEKVQFVTPTTKHLVDITHTVSAPYLTGIQRVVREIMGSTDETEVTGFTLDPHYGLIQKASFDDYIHEDFSKIKHIESNRLELMLRIFFKMQKNTVTRGLSDFFRPFAKQLKNRIVKSKMELAIHELGSAPIMNLLILKRAVTLPEIPATGNQIGIYETIFESNLVTSQVILYDFIPFFHAWTVHHANRGHLNSYIRIVFLANKVVSISKLVDEQARLIIQAFSLERHEWAIRERKFSFLGLPSGLTMAGHHEFLKEPTLVTMVGSIEPRKNHVQFMDALEILYSQGIRVKARLLGSQGWNNDEILARLTQMQNMGIDVQRLKVSDSELRDFIGKSQLLLQISEAEGFGLPIIEALSLGTRVLVSDIRPLNEWNHPWIEVIPLGNAQLLADKIRIALQTPQTYLDAQDLGLKWSDWKQELFDI